MSKVGSKGRRGTGAGRGFFGFFNKNKSTEEDDPTKNFI